MSAAAIALTWTAGLLVGFLLPTVFFLRRQVQSLRSRLAQLEAVAESQDARLFVLEEELRWLSANGTESGETVPEF
ncbi:hypothetical protein [Terriglobus aquaticus]|uniref:Phage shock protein B n=1 Tax=Terriglobus aquaticus TaxID=940139 RepID=A0ABW9KIV9_9BACT|nr:hypothetical protein [Terriglobus aquaticus]